MQTIQNAIDGRKVTSASRRIAPVYNPATGEQIAELPLSTAEEVNAAVAAAKKAADGWGATPPLKRIKPMFRFKELLDRNADDIARAISREHGKTHDDALGELARGIDVVDFACGIPHLLKGEFSRNVGPEIDTWSDRQPLGVVAGITPFNFPAMVPMWMYPVAIACGNTFVLKPSERDPSPSMLIWELFQEAGFPPGVLNVVHGDKEAVDAILDHPDIKAVSFVGSTPVAEHVYRRGSASGKRVQALGGAKNHMIVMPDADMDQAVDALMGAGFGSAGERCMAISVAVPVGEKTADRLVEALAPKIRTMKVGPATDPRLGDGPGDHGRGQAAHRGSHRPRRQGRRRARRRRARPRAAGLRARLLPRRLAVRPRHQGHDHLQDRDLRARPLRGAGRQLRGGRRPRQQPRIWQRRRHLHPRRRHGPRLRRLASRSAWSASMCRSRFRSPITPSAAGSGRCSAITPSTAPKACASTRASRP